MYLRTEVAVFGHPGARGGSDGTRAGFPTYGRLLGELAAERCDGRILAVLEGGYDLRAMPRLAAAHLNGLAAGATGE